MQKKIRKDLTGKRFGRLTVLGHIISSGKILRIRCRCSCGTVVTPLRSNVCQGRTVSCGCRAAEYRRSPKKHGHATGGREAFSSEYKSWEYMLRRTRYKGTRSGRWHADRGISVCRRWLTFINFLKDMGRQPKGKTLDRRNNEKGYSPSNCRWATNREQSRNKRNNRFFEWDGLKLLVPDWSKRLGIKKATIWNRINAGWILGDVFSKPVRALK